MKVCICVVYILSTLHTVHIIIWYSWAQLHDYIENSMYERFSRLYILMLGKKWTVEYPNPIRQNKNNDVDQSHAMSSLW